MSVYIYDEKAGEIFLTIPALTTAPAGWLLKAAGPAWTISDHLDMKADAIVVTHGERLTSRKPVLLRSFGEGWVFTALTDRGASGTLQSIEKVYILTGMP